ncbi:MAG: hypothetical protein CUN57_00705, partial [Phototrophicales bacterium]
GEVSLVLYDINGRMVRTVTDGERMMFGKNKIRFDVSGLKPGTYIARLSAGRRAFTANIVVSR